MIRLVLALLLLSGPAFGQEAPHPKESRLFRALGVSFLIVNTIDVAQTSHMMGTGEFRELNPVLRPIADHPVALGAVKESYGLFLNYATAQVYRTKPKHALALRIFFVATQAAVVGWNVREMRKGHR